MKKTILKLVKPKYNELIKNQLLTQRIKELASFLQANGYVVNLTNEFNTFNGIKVECVELFAHNNHGLYVKASSYEYNVSEFLDGYIMFEHYSYLNKWSYVPNSIYIYRDFGEIVDILSYYHSKKNDKKDKQFRDDYGINTLNYKNKVLKVS